MTFAILVPASGVCSAPGVLFGVFILMLLVYAKAKPSRQRMVLAVVFALAATGVLIASDDDILMLPLWLAWWAAGCNWC
jgi:uncharacterized membrane protein